MWNVNLYIQSFRVLYWQQNQRNNIKSISEDTQEPSSIVTTPIRVWLTHSVTHNNVAVSSTSILPLVWNTLFGNAKFNNFVSHTWIQMINGQDKRLTCVGADGEGAARIAWSDAESQTLSWVQVVIDCFKFYDYFTGRRILWNWGVVDGLDCERGVVVLILHSDEHLKQINKRFMRIKKKTTTRTNVFVTEAASLVFTILKLYFNTTLLPKLQAGFWAYPASYRTDSGGSFLEG